MMNLLVLIFSFGANELLNLVVLGGEPTDFLLSIMINEVVLMNVRIPPEDVLVGIESVN